MEEWFQIYLAIFLFIILYVLYKSIKRYLRKRKAKKLKYEWTWIIKKAKVFDIRKRYVSWDRDSSWYYLYWLEAEDENGNLFNSETFRDAEHGWRTLEDMVVKYDGVTYDLWKKDEAIKQINDNIHRLEMELSNDPWFFKKRELKRDIEAMKRYIDMANEWPVDPYLMCNGHKVSVWDIIDVFVDPGNPELYYFDLDFTKEK